MRSGNSVQLFFMSLFLQRIRADSVEDNLQSSAFLFLKDCLQELENRGLQDQAAAQYTPVTAVVHYNVQCVHCLKNLLDIGTFYAITQYACGNGISILCTVRK